MNRHDDKSDYFFYSGLKLFYAVSTEIIPIISKEFSEDQTIKIWCVSNFSVHDTYSMLMAADTHLPSEVFQKVETVATFQENNGADNNPRGTFTNIEVQRGLPKKFLLKYFKQNTNDNWEISSKIRDKVQSINSDLNEYQGQLDQFHMIFCPNLFSTNNQSETEKNTDFF